MNFEFVTNAVKSRSAAGRRGLKRNAPMWLSPDATERAYRTALLELVDKLESEVRTQLISRLPTIVEQRFNADGVRHDSWPEDIEAAMLAISAGMLSAVQAVKRRLSTWSKDVSEFNRRQFSKVMRNTLGVDIFTTEPWLVDDLEAWSKENAALITSIPDQATTTIEGIAMRGVRSGASVGDVTEEIMKAIGSTRNRARLIARDQIAKLNADLTEKRQRSIGVRTYTWNTSRDERVRRAHKVLQGMLCRWDDATVYSDDGGQTWKKRSSIGGVELHPGRDYQCRCHARANVEQVLEEAGV